MKTVLEHLNVTVSNPEKTAELLCKLFDWKVRWHGPSQLGGYTYHVGEEGSYLAVYAPDRDTTDRRAPGGVRGGLNHIAVVVDDLDGAEARILEAGFETLNHGDYEPGRRFYFYDHDGIEYEVVSYV